MRNKIIFIIFTMFIFNGMKNVNQLNDLAIVSAIGVDVNDDGEYIITSQILNPKKEESSGSGTSSSKSASDIVVYHATSTSIQNALRNIVEESPRRLYLAHMELLMISEKVAKQENILDTLDFFIRDNEGSNDFLLVITKGTNPQKVLEILTPLETNPAKNIKDSIIATNKYKGICTDRTLSENIEMFLNEGQSAVLTSIEIDYHNKEIKNEAALEEEIKNTPETNKKIEEEENSISSDEKQKVGKQTNQDSNFQEDSSSSNSQTTQSSNKPEIKVSYLGYFKEKSLDGYLDNDASFIYNLLQNDAKSGIIRTSKEEDLIVTKLIRSKVDMKPKKENDQYKMDIQIDITCALGEVGKNIKFDHTENIEKYQKVIADKVKEEVENFITSCQENYDCDLMGFGTIYHKYKVKDYQEMKEKYGRDYFKHIKPIISVKVKFPNEGGITNIW